MAGEGKGTYMNSTTPPAARIRRVVFAQATRTADFVYSHVSSTDKSPTESDIVGRHLGRPVAVEVEVEFQSGQQQREVMPVEQCRLAMFGEWRKSRVESLEMFRIGLRGLRPREVDSVGIDE